MGHREAKQARTRARIQREASRLLLQRGYEATTLPAIAAAADLAPRTLFSYFESKEAIFLADAPAKLAAVVTAVERCQSHDPPAVIAEVLTEAATLGSASSLYEGHDVHAVMLAIVTTPQLAGALVLQTAATARALAEALAAHCDVALRDAHALVGTTFGHFSGQLLFRGSGDLSDEDLGRVMVTTLQRVPALWEAIRCEPQKSKSLGTTRGQPSR